MPYHALLSIILMMSCRCWLPVEDIDTEQQDFLARLLGRQSHITAVGCGAWELRSVKKIVEIYRI